MIKDYVQLYCGKCNSTMFNLVIPIGQKNNDGHYQIVCGECGRVIGTVNPYSINFATDADATTDKD